MKNVPTIIFNPIAGGGKAAQKKEALQELLKAHYGQTFEFAETRGPGDAELLCRQAIENGAQLIIAAGGDGTIHEVVNGFFSKGQIIQPRCELGILNFGTGGDLVKSLKLPTKISDQLHLIDQAIAKPIDIGLVTYVGKDASEHQRYFINECQVGVGADIVSRVGFQQKRLGGAVAFGLATLPEIFCVKSKRIKIKLDGRIREDELFGVYIANGRYSGGGMQLTPSANLSDGLFDILFIHDMSLLERCLAFSKVYFGKHLSSKGFSLRQGREIAIESTPPVQVEADGEILGYTPCAIRILPQAIGVRFAR